MCKQIYSNHTWLSACVHTELTQGASPHHPVSATRPSAPGVRHAGNCVLTAMGTAWCHHAPGRERHRHPPLSPQQVAEPSNCIHAPRSAPKTHDSIRMRPSGHPLVTQPRAICTDGGPCTNTIYTDRHRSCPRQPGHVGVLVPECHRTSPQAGMPVPNLPVLGTHVEMKPSVFCTHPNADTDSASTS